MSSLYNYLFTRTPKVQEQEKISEEIISEFPKIDEITKPKKVHKKQDSAKLRGTDTPRTIYLVMNKNSGTPIGVYDVLQTAIEQGNNNTYHNAVVYDFKVNEGCRYLRVPVYESR